MRAFCLSFHARYLCAHSGACCTAGWPIQLEEDDRITVLPMTPDGACVFFDRDGDRLCAIHRDRGVERMPTACRNFPRVTLRDQRGVFITLSHFCPTAARLLLDPGDITIVEAPASISLNGSVEGLDASAVMPPLLRRGMLMDLDGYGTWEKQAISVLNDRRYSARVALEIISTATSQAITWSPGRESLASIIDNAFARARGARGDDERSPKRALDHPLKAFLASHLFASWAAYQGGGVMAVVDAVRTALELVEPELTGEEPFIESVRAADLRLRHMAFPSPTPDPAISRSPDPAIAGPHAP